MKESPYIPPGTYVIKSLTTLVIEKEVLVVHSDHKEPLVKPFTTGTGLVKIEFGVHMLPEN